MAILFIDGFDKYGPTNHSGPSLQLAMAGEWTYIDSSDFVYVGEPLSATGQSLVLRTFSNVTSTLRKTLPGNFSTLIGGFRFRTDLVNSFGLSLTDGVTDDQIIIEINALGQIAMWSGHFDTLLGISSVAIPANTTHMLEFTVTIHDTVGSYNIYLDGVSVVSGSGQNTRGGSTNNYTNNFRFLGLARDGGTSLTRIDDLYIFDNSGSAPYNAPLLANTRIETQLPSSDDQQQFTVGAGVVGNYYVLNDAANIPTASSGAGINLIRFRNSVAQTLNSVSLMSVETNTNVRLKGVVYSDDDGAVDTLLSSGTEVTGVTAAVPRTLQLTSPQALSADTYYWIGFIFSETFNMRSINIEQDGRKASITYASGAPSTGASITTTQYSLEIWGNCTGASPSYAEVNLSPPGGTLSYVSSSTPGDEDRLNFPSLSASPNLIYTVKVSAMISKSEAGVRTVDIGIRTGGTDYTGTASGFAPGDSPLWVATYFDDNPATSVSWLAAALNASKGWYKVAS